MNYNHQEQYDSGDDSDIQEVAIIPPRHATSTPQCSPPTAKRRKSSPQMDPIPSYTPTPIHLLESMQKSRSSGSSSYHTAPNDSSNHGDTGSNNNYLSESSPSPDDNHRSHSRRDEYTPLLHPNPDVIGSLYSCDLSPPRATPAYREGQSTTSHPNAARLPARKSSNPSAPRPVSSALAQAVASRRGSMQELQRQQKSASKTLNSHLDVSSTSSEYAERPVMWSPKLPSQIEPVKDEDTEREKAKLLADEHAKCKAPRSTKTRVAHKPTIPVNKQNRPRMPLGTSKKVPLAFRVKYLDVIITEFLNTGHTEDESYEQALKEEQTLATRAANKNIYVNLVASLKKKIRESVGISTKLSDEDPKYVNGNKVVSHDEILTGKVIGTFSIQRKRKTSDPAELNEYELYDRLQRYILPVDQLEDYGYPFRDPENPELRQVPKGKNGQKQQLRNALASSYTCDRCMKVYRIGDDGMPLDTTSKCIFHPGHLWNERINRALEKRYSCCKGDPSAGGCSSNPYHVHKGELELQNYQGYVETVDKPERDPNRHGIYALDCEMCYTTYGLELTRVTVINHKHDVVYEELVKPHNPILDYNTKYSGIKEGDLDDVTKSLEDVQQDLMRMFSSKTILVGHSLDSDMKALRIFHKHFIDTAQLFPHKRGLPFKRALRTLMVENLRVIIQEDSGHDSKEDAIAAFRLVMWKAKTDVPEKAT